MSKLLVIDRRRRVTFVAQDAKEADFIAKDDALGVETIEHCLEEYGRCDGTDFTIIPEEWENPEDKNLPEITKALGRYESTLFATQKNMLSMLDEMEAFQVRAILKDLLDEAIEIKEQEKEVK